MINNSLNNQLNLLRWLAALMVVIGHLRSFLFVSYSNIENHTIFTKFFYFITGFGHQAVIVFFVISGYLVGGAVLKAYKNNKINSNFLKTYLIKRWSRIYVVLLPALVIGFILDSVGAMNFEELYINVYKISAMNFNVSQNLSMEIFLFNLFNLQTILAHPLGTNGPLWSLANEWAYYMLFIVLFINNFSRIIFLLFFILLLIMNYNILLYAIIWILGAFIVLQKKQILNKYISYILFFLILILSRKVHGVSVDIFLALSLSLVINSLYYEQNKNIYLENINKKMANFSYTLYLFHFPFFVFVIALIHKLNYNIVLMQPDIYSFIWYIFILVSIYLYSYIGYLLFEKNTEKVKYYLINKYIKEPK